MQMLGVDIGGSGIKGCLVDTATGELIGERHRLVTPQPATPAAVAHTLKALVEHFDWKGPVGCGFPPPSTTASPRVRPTSTKAGLRPTSPTCSPT